MGNQNCAHPRHSGATPIALSRSCPPRAHIVLYVDEIYVACHLGLGVWGRHVQWRGFVVIHQDKPSQRCKTKDPNPRCQHERENGVLATIHFVHPPLFHIWLFRNRSILCELGCFNGPPMSQSHALVERSCDHLIVVLATGMRPCARRTLVQWTHKVIVKSRGLTLLRT